MGMYTELQINCRLKREDDLIRFLLGQKDDIENAPEWARCGMFNGFSAYFDYESKSEMVTNGYDETYLNTRFNIKNYRGQLESFIEYLHPLIEAYKGDFIGFMRYEEEEYPTLLMYGESKIVFKEVE